MTDIAVLAAQRAALLADIEDAKHEIAKIDAQLLDAIEVGGAVCINDEPVYRIQQKKPFDVEKASKVLPAELVAACTETVTTEVVNKERLEAMATAMGLRSQCLKPGNPYVAKAKSVRA